MTPMHVLRFLKRLTLTQYIFIGFFLGIAAGWLFGEGILPVAEILADIFLRLLRMAIMPLIVTSIVSGVVSVGSAAGLGRLGLKTFGYYITSTGYHMQDAVLDFPRCRSPIPCAPVAQVAAIKQNNSLSLLSGSSERHRRELCTSQRTDQEADRLE